MAQISNVYNYAVKDQTPHVREHHKGPAVPTRLDCDIDFIISKLKTAAETAIPEGLGMTELECIIKKSDEVLCKGVL